MSNSSDYEFAPFTVVIDSNEGTPFLFQGIKSRKIGGVRKPMIIRTVRKPMWAMQREERGIGLADYSIDGLEQLVQIERKSIEDLFGTLGSRRENFENEVRRMNDQCEAACVIVEAGWGHIAGYKGPGPEASSVVGTIISWQQRYQKVHWILAGSRDMAERLAWRFLERYWLNREERIRAERKSASTTSAK